MANYHWTILHNEDDYQKAMARFEQLFGKEFNEYSEESDEFELLALLIEKYENVHYPIDNPSPVEYIKFIMDQKGLKNKDMVKYMGSLSKVSEVLNGKRNLSLNMIKKLHNGLNIPTDILIKDINDIDENIIKNNEIHIEKTGTLQTQPEHINYNYKNRYEYSEERSYSFSTIFA